jgi:hypothetical protein
MLAELRFWVALLMKPEKFSLPQEKTRLDKVEVR